jgi:hypothetical protein
VRLLVAILALEGCTFASTGEDWQAQLAPDGPCYDANLLDGVDESSPAELHAVFACVNGTGALDAYAPLDAALDGDTRDGVAGVVLAHWINTLPLADLSLGALLTDGIALLDDPTGLFDGLHLGLELVYGAPWPWLGDAVPLNSQAALDGGILVPLLPTAGAVAGAVLDDDLAPLGPVEDLLRSDVARSATWTLASVGVSANPTLASFERTWAADLGDGIARTADADNDRWSGASGNSVRDLAGALLTDSRSDGRVTLDHLADPLAPILADPRLRDALGVVLRQEGDADRLDVLPAQVLYLASVDTDGGTLTPGEDSALTALIRLLHDGNTDVDCSIDLYLFDFDISLGNLSVALLQLLARQDPSTVDGGVDLLGNLLGVSLTDDVLDTIADSGVCPEIDPQLVSDLHAIDRLNDPATDELLLVLLDVLAAFDDQGRVPDLVDTLAAAHDLALVAPVEEVLRDTGDTALATDLMRALPVLLDPDDYHDRSFFPAGIAPLDYTAVWDAAADVLVPAADGTTPFDTLEGPVEAALGRDGTWTALDHLGALLVEPEALVGGALPDVADLCNADPTLSAYDSLADTLADDDLVRAPLVLVEATGLRTALGHTELVAPGPIPFTATLVHGGTLGILLDTLDILTTLLPEDE